MKYFVLFPKTGRTVEEQKSIAERMAQAAAALYGTPGDDVEFDSDWRDGSVEAELDSSVVKENIDKMSESDFIIVGAFWWDHPGDVYSDILRTTATGFESLKSKCREIAIPA